MVKDEGSSGTPEEELSRRKKRRNVGAFPCSKCSKVFSRSDHLARHYLNHQPKQVYVCDFCVTDHNGTKRACGKTFVRRDLRERHYRRHLSERPDDSLDSEPPEGKVDVAPSPLDISNLIEVKDENPMEPQTVQPTMNQNITAVETKGIPTPNLIEPDTIKATEAAREEQNNPLMSNAGTTASNHLQQYQKFTYNAPPSTQNNGTNPIIGLEMDRNNFLNHPRHNSVPLHAHNVRSSLVPPLQQPNTYQQPPPPPPPPQQLQHQHQQHAPMPLHMPIVNPSNQNYPASQQYLYGSLPTPIPANIMPIRSQSHVPGGLDSTRNEENLAKSGDVFPAGSNFVPSQNDILSWLFMESPHDMSLLPSMSTPNSIHSGIAEPLNTGLMNHTQNNLQTSDHQEQVLQRQNVVSGSDWYRSLNSSGTNAMDPILNVGLHDLNYFSKSENPLDEVFLKMQSGQMGSSPGDMKFRNINMVSTNSTSSPTNTNESPTPQSFSDIHVNGIDRGTVKERLQFHSAKLNIENNKHFYMSKALWASIMDSLPELTMKSLMEIFDEEDDISIIEHRMSFYLYGYWETFHRRFSILHKPSFSTSTAEPLLLLAMLIVGCMYCATTPADHGKKMACPEYKFCMLVAEPLRFKLFQHPRFRCPVAVWVLQSLNLLEWCEKNYLARHMHERAHIHHGTTVQLLRRSPFLGGNPTVKNKPNSSETETSTSGSEENNSDGIGNDSEYQLNNDQSLFRDWLESESMKRITFMTFYLDTIDYIKFRHNPQIPFFQLQLLNLPCDEENLWECNEINDSFKKLVKRQKKLQSSTSAGVRNMKDLNKIKPDMNFLSALKKLMKPQNARQKYSFFTRSILFGGLVSIMHQMQQTELQNHFTILSSHSDKNRNSPWKELLVRALDAYEADLHSATIQMSSDPLFKVEEYQCKFPMYHLVSIIGIADINHYDIAIFGGSQRNMSVDASSKDISIVKRKLKTIWNTNGAMHSFKDLANIRSVIHCYWLLWSLMLPPLNDEGGVDNSRKLYPWDADHDCFDVLYAASIATLVLWCYTFSTCGLESSVFKDLEDSFPIQDQKSYEKLSPLIIEDGYNYLFRIREEFSKCFNKQGLEPDYCIHKTGANRRRVPLFDAIQKHCEALPQICCKQNISGLCFLVGTKLYRSQWEIIRENAKLIINCGLRSIGKSSWHCPDLFENDFAE
ncbi:hypothetical protein JCM33374_g5443 [Metschnikowia sp. JCM 33374]|nr:hypothetical protein JCM33374_g5443 [Metschnikowia sp. JCM 33374]